MITPLIMLSSDEKYERDKLVPQSQEALRFLEPTGIANVQVPDKYANILLATECLLIYYNHH